MPAILLDDTMGVTLIGVVVAGALWGVSCVQCFFYYSNFPEESIWYIKPLVAGVFISDTIHQILITHTIYTYLVTHFGNYVQLGEIVWSLVLQVLFNGFTGFMVQCFLTSRVWTLSKFYRPRYRHLITGSVLALVIGEFVSVLVYFAKARTVKTFEEVVTLKASSITINAFGAAADVLIAITLCVLLHTERSGLKSSNTIINRLILFTINTGLLTSICAVASLVSILAAPNTFVYIAFFFNIGRFYSNTLMATLNCRVGIRAAQAQSISLSTFGPAPISPITPIPATPRWGDNTTVTVDITRDQHDSDSDQYTTDVKADMSGEGAP